MDVVILVPAVVTSDNHLEMVRVQSLLRDRLRLYDHTSPVRIHSCVIFDAISPRLIRDAFDLDFSLKLIGSHLYPDASAPSGIRRPVEFALRALSQIFRPAELTYVLRVIQDAFIDDAQSLLNSLKALLDRRDDFVAGELASCSDIGPFLDKVGVPRASHYPYVQGSVMFARLDLWLTHYPRMPAAVTHFCDDSVMSQLARHAGSELVPMTRHWRHLHDCSSDDLAQIYLQHSKELAPDVTAAHSLPRRRTPPIPAGSSAIGELDAIALHCGTDKSSTHHGYAQCYERLWCTRRQEPLVILEFGVAAGNSMRMWREYFPNAQIIGIDSDPQCLSTQGLKIRIIVGRQEDGCLAKRMAAEYPNGFDIIIDDGGHMWDAQQTALQMYFPLVKRRGCYVIEDLHTSYWAHHRGHAQRSTMDVLRDRLDDLMLHGESEVAGRDESVAIPRRTLNIFERELEGVIFFRGLAVLRPPAFDRPLKRSISLNVSPLLRQIVESRLRTFCGFGDRRLCLIGRSGYTAVEKNWGYLYREDLPPGKQKEGSECEDFIRLMLRKDKDWCFLLMEDRNFGDSLKNAAINTFAYSDAFGEPETACFPFGQILKCLVQVASLCVGVPAGPYHLAAQVESLPTVGIWIDHLPSWYDEPREGVIHVIGSHAAAKLDDPILPGSFIQRGQFSYAAQRTDLRTIPGAAVMAAAESIASMTA